MRGEYRHRPNSRSRRQLELVRENRFTSDGHENLGQVLELSRQARALAAGNDDEVIGFRRRMRHLAAKCTGDFADGAQHRLIRAELRLPAKARQPFV